MKSLTNHCLELKQQDKKALVTYVTAGLGNWIDVVHACANNGADVLEIGLPFSDPVMDGPVIAEASAKAIASGAKTLDLIDQISKANFSKPVVIMTYANVLYSHGVKEIVAALKEVGISGLILPDLTYEQSGLFADELKDTDISLIPLVASTTDESRRKSIIDSAQGFLYCVAIKGITGQGIDINSHNEFIEDITKSSPVPTYCGVGIRTPEDAKTIVSSCDGVIVGTSIVEKMLASSDSAKDVANLVGELKSAIS